MNSTMASCVAAIFAALALCNHAVAQTNTFSLRADPPSIELAPGHSAPVTISSSLVDGSAETIVFDASGLPANATLSFDPLSVQTGAPTTLTITTSSTAILGTQATITVRGTAASDTETATVSLRVASYVSQEEWTALAALYNSTGGSTWTTNTGWDVSGTGPNGTECAWHGIVCDATPHITGLELANNNLSGPLPDLSALGGLVTLDVAGNQLSGSIGFVGALSNLQYFGGDDNAFTGTLPQFTSLPNLMGFSVPGNQLTGAMPSLSLSTKLVYLSVASNYLSGAVPLLSGLPKLQYLYIADNRFTGSMPNPPNPTRLGSGVAQLCPNFFAAVASVPWNLYTRTIPWYSACDTDTIFEAGFGAPPLLQ